MFQYLRRKPQPDTIHTDPSRLSREWLARDPRTPISLLQINNLPENAKVRIYRNLLPPSLATRFSIDPISWQGIDREAFFRLEANEGSGNVHIWGHTSSEPTGEFFRLEMGDNAFNGIDLHLLVLNDPEKSTFRTDIDEHGNNTHFGTARRNLQEEQRAMLAGLAPAQIRGGLGASRGVFDQIDTFIATLGHQAYFLEPLTYVSAWVFERRGFAYVRGHKLMDDIHQGFLPGGSLHHALTNDSIFRQPEQWKTVRGRAWAIHDGILEVIDATWDNLRMVKRVGKHAGVETFPDAVY